MGQASKYRARRAERQRLQAAKLLAPQVLSDSVLVLLTHLVDAGERLTLGRCPACVERGGRWEWLHAHRQTEADGLTQLGGWAQGYASYYAWANNFIRHLSRPCPACSEPGGPVECKACNGSGSLPLPSRRNPGPRTTMLAASNPGWSAHIVVGLDGVSTRTGLRPCTKCKGTGSQPGPGVPTGLRRVSSAEALLPARPGPWSSRSIEAVHGEPDKDTASLLQATMDKWADAGHEVERLTNHVFRERKPGDPDARAELHEYADRRQHHGDPLGRWLALWLSGAPCEACEGQRCQHLTGNSWVPGVESMAANRDCPACHGDGTALGQQLDAMIPETRLRDDGADALACAADALAQAPTGNSP